MGQVKHTYQKNYKEKNMTNNKIWKITEKGIELAEKYKEHQLKTIGGEYREFMKTHSPILESGKTIAEEEMEEEEEETEK
tara:strand:- start:182 stop:421 length:240 start_codon:yes stop_codon:yes gene_type:complete